MWGEIGKVLVDFSVCVCQNNSKLVIRVEAPPPPPPGFSQKYLHVLLEPGTSGGVSSDEGTGGGIVSFSNRRLRSSGKMADFQSVESLSTMASIKFPSFSTRST